jgi:RNA polymerase sigma-70 factor, ECF subfamily
MTARVSHRSRRQEKPPSSVGQTLPLDFHGVYEAWFSEVSRWIRALGGPASEQEDLTQDVFVVVHRRLHDFDGHNLAGWLYQITRRRVRDFRRLQWVKQLVFSGAPLDDHPDETTKSPCDSLETAQKRAMLELLLKKLNESERTALIMFEIEGYSGDEIAAIQGVKASTIWVRVSSARRKLLELLAKQDARSERHIR